MEPACATCGQVKPLVHGLFPVCKDCATGVAAAAGMKARAALHDVVDRAFTAGALGIGRWLNGLKNPPAANNDNDTSTGR